MPTPVNDKKNIRRKILDQLLDLLSGLPWLDLLATGWTLFRRLAGNLAEKGMYEVLSYGAKLELLDGSGRRARFTKRQSVKYLQNNIIAYQDQVWGEGETLINYRCSPGQVADRYRLGYKTIILISLREMKERGDEDEFIIEREIHDGFPSDQEYLEVEVSHRTRRLQMVVVFPKSRPPMQPSLLEQQRRRETELPATAVKQLPDGRWQLSWETSQPRLHEHYLLRWQW